MMQFDDIFNDRGLCCMSCVGKYFSEQWKRCVEERKMSGHENCFVDLQSRTFHIIQDKKGGESLERATAPIM